MVVYVDILLILNLFVDYFLLLGCCILLKTDVKKWRLVVGALVGSLFSLSIFVANFSFFLFFLFKVFSGIILVLVTFGFRTKALFLKFFSVFFVENFVFAGVMFCVWTLFSPPGMFWQNGVTYIAISPMVLVFGSVVAYFLTYFFNLIVSKRVDGKKIYSIKIRFNNKTIETKALYDTGNCLTEPFSKKPICICEFDVLRKVLPKDLASFFNDLYTYSFDEAGLENFSQIKMVPCRTINGESVLPAFLPQGFFVICNGEEVKYDCYVGVTNRKISDGEYSAVVGDFR